MPTPEKDEDSPRPADGPRDDPSGGREATGGAPLGGDETTQEQLEADNPAEEATLATLDPDAPPP